MLVCSYVHILCRSLKLTECDLVDDVMSECTAALMQEQVDTLCDTEAGEVIMFPATEYYEIL